jgi:hypothetical protein
LKPFLGARLHYIEEVCWRRSADAIDITIWPSILKGRAAIEALYALSHVTDGILRRYTGTVSVDVALFSTRIERGIVAEFERSMPIAAACTQNWLDRQDRSLTARA